MSWSSRRKKECIFCTVYFVQKDIFFKICVLSQCIMYWIHFQNIYTSTYQKTLLHICSFLKSLKAFSVKPTIYLQQVQYFPDKFPLRTMHPKINTDNCRYGYNSPRLRDGGNNFMSNWSSIINGVELAQGSWLLWSYIRIWQVINVFKIRKF